MGRSRDVLSKRWTATGPGQILICTGCNLPVREYTELVDLPQGGRIRFCEDCMEELFLFRSRGPGLIQKWKAVVEAAREMLAISPIASDEFCSLCLYCDGGDGTSYFDDDKFPHQEGCAFKALTAALAGQPTTDPRDAVVEALEAENAALRATKGSWINKQMTEADRAKQRDWQAHDETAICGVCEAPLLVHYEVSPDPGRWTQTYKRTEQAVVAAAQILVKARHWEMMTSRLDPNVAALMAALEGLDG